MRSPDDSQHPSLFRRKDYYLVCCLTFFVLLAQTVAAQVEATIPMTATEPTRKNELCVNFLAVVDRNPELVRWNLPVGYRPSVMNGLMYKRHFGQNAWRLGFDSFRDHYKRDYGPIRPYRIVSNTNRIDLRLGYQRMLTKGKLKPYFGADVLWTLGRTTGTYETELGPNGPAHTVFRGNQDLIGVSVIAGVAYKPWKRFSITAEASAFFGHLDHKEFSKTVFPVIGEVSGTSGNTRFWYFIDPLRSLAVSYYF